MGTWPTQTVLQNMDGIVYLVLSPIGVLMRVFGKDFLDQRWDKGAASYWIKKEKKPFDKKQYEKLY
jgi:hypothetical protein